MRTRGIRQILTLERFPMIKITSNIVYKDDGKVKVSEVVEKGDHQMELLDSKVLRVGSKSYQEI